MLEGKQIEPFRVSIDTSRYELRPGADVKKVMRRARLAYRDVASATNRLTLIAAVIPAACRHDAHALLPEDRPLSADAQQVLCAC